VKKPEIVIDESMFPPLIQAVDRNGYVHFLRNRVCQCCPGVIHKDESEIDTRTEEEIAAGELPPKVSEPGL
jgi:hypothetical protein